MPAKDEKPDASFSCCPSSGEFSMKFRNRYGSDPGEGNFMSPDGIVSGPWRFFFKKNRFVGILWSCCLFYFRIFFISGFSLFPGILINN